MSTELLDRLQENKLRGLEEWIDAWKVPATMDGGQDEAAALAVFFGEEGLGVRRFCGQGRGPCASLSSGWGSASGSASAA